MHFTNTRSFSRILTAALVGGAGLYSPTIADHDTGATGKGHFVGAGCGLCANAQWKIDSRSLR